MNTYKSLPGNGDSSMCTPCAKGTSTDGQTGSTDCNFCQEGFGGNAPNCIACQSGFVKLTVGNTECRPKSESVGTNPFASMLGMSDVVFYAIIGSIAGVLLGLIALIAIIRRNQKKKRANVAKQDIIQRELAYLAAKRQNLQNAYTTNMMTNNHMPGFTHNAGMPYSMFPTGMRTNARNSVAPTNMFNTQTRSVMPLMGTNARTTFAAQNNMGQVYPMTVNRQTMAQQNNRVFPS